MSRRFTVFAVAVVSFVLGGLLSHSGLHARPDTSAVVVGLGNHGKCVGVAAAGQSFIFRAFEDGTVEMSRWNNPPSTYGPWEKTGN